MNTNELNWKDIKVSKTRDRENYENLLEKKLPQYQEVSIDDLRHLNPCRKGKKVFNKYLEDTSIKDTHKDAEEYLEGLQFVDSDLKMTEADDYWTSYHKMEMWRDGERGFNAAAASDEKLKRNFEICKKLKFSKGIMLIWAEMKRRGLIDEN